MYAGGLGSGTKTQRLSSGRCPETLSIARETPKISYQCFACFDSKQEAKIMALR